MKETLSKCTGIILAGIMLFAAIGCGTKKTEKTNEIDPSQMKEIGTVTDENGDVIHLFEGCDMGEGYIYAYYINDNSYIPAKIIHEKYENKDSYTYLWRFVWDELVSSEPYKSGYAFNPNDSTLYIAEAENLMMGHHPCRDRFNVYKFNGKTFEFIGVDGGFWLHPSIREFGGLDGIWRTEDYLYRVDEMRLYDERVEGQYEQKQIDTCRYRFAAWKNKENMEEAPDILIDNGYYDKERHSYVFNIKGEKYIAGKKLQIYKGGKMAVEQDAKLIVSTTDLKYSFEEEVE